MSKKIAQVLVIGLISGFLVALPAAAQTAKQSAPASAPWASSEVKAKKAVPNDVVKAVQEALNKEGYKLKVDGLMGKHTRSVSNLTRRKMALRRRERRMRLPSQN